MAKKTKEKTQDFQEQKTKN
jgi:hypothetical protein